MKRIFTLPLLLSIAVLSLILVPFLVSSDPAQSSPFRFEIKLATAVQGHVRVYFDLGNGFSEMLSARQTIEPGKSFRRYRFVIPFGTCRGLRLEPIDARATVILADARIVTKNNALIHAFSPQDFLPVDGVSQIERRAGLLKVMTVSDAPGPAVNIPLSTPLILKPRNLLPGLACEFSLVYVACCALIASVLSAPAGTHRRMTARLGQAIGYFRLRPARAIVAMALFSVVVSCYPVVFLGRSFVSPNLGTPLLYDRFPTLPGYDDPVMEGAQGSDVGAMLWADVPYSVVQHRALLHDRELPLWNRYNSGGVTLLGQGQSMFGDPLHLLVIAANGAAWAWDLKFLIAKWLFTCAMGLLVWQGARHLPSALLATFASPFIGVFLVRINHPAFFSFCYAPWILYSWSRLSTAATRRSTAAWCGILLLSCWTEMNSGTVKETYMLLVAMSLAGVTGLLFTQAGWRKKSEKILFATWTGFLLLLISSPIWFTLLDTLQNSYNDYADSISVLQTPLVLLIGLFDEIFYRPVTEAETIFNPSVNFLIFFGVLYALATFHRTTPSYLKRAMAVNVMILLSIVFGLVPAQWLVRVPFLAGVQHINDSFSLALVIELIVLAGFGFQAACTRLSLPEARGDLIISGLLFGVILFPYIAIVNQGMSSLIRAPVSPFVRGSLAALPAAGILLTLVMRKSLIHRQWSPARGILAIACLLVLLGRFGQQAHIGSFDNYILNPATRVDFHAKSAALETVLADRGSPFRVIGFENNLFPGWNAVYGLEGLSGPDAFMNPYYRQLLEACGLDRQWTWRIVAHVDTLAALKPSYDFVNVKYYFDHPGDNQSPPGKVLRTVTKADLDVYASDTVWPRAFFTDRLAVYDTVSTLGQMIRQGDGRPFAAIEASDQAQGPPLPASLAGRVVVPAINYQLTANTTSFQVTTKGPGVIVLQEPWLKDGFHVKINGRPAKYLRINHAFKGVVVDAAGIYSITFAYWPHNFTLALILCGTGLVLLAGSWMTIKRSTH